MGLARSTYYYRSAAEIDEEPRRRKRILEIGLNRLWWSLRATATVG